MSELILVQTKIPQIELIDAFSELPSEITNWADAGLYFLKLRRMKDALYCLNIASQLPDKELAKKGNLGLALYNLECRLAYILC